MDVRHKAAIGAVASLLTFGAGYWTGHRPQPSVVQTKDQITQTVKKNETSKVVVDTKRAQNREVNKDVVKDRTTTKFPDGRVVVEERTADHTKTDTKTNETKVVTKEVVKTVEVVKVEIHEKLILSRPSWLLGAYGGVSVPGLLGSGTGTSLLPELPGKATIGLSLEHRLFGNVYGGVHLDTRGQVMVGVTVAF